jgi:hypothetical protein
MNLDSAFGGPEDSPREFLNKIPGATGPLSEVRQTFTWTETLKK